MKGTANEDILSRFLSQQTGARRIAARSAIIDHLGGRSDEVDVVVLNDSQPFWTGESGQLLIAEGVDADETSEPKSELCCYSSQGAPTAPTPRSTSTHLATSRDTDTPTLNISNGL